jgi:hypothetical protein
MLRKIYGTNFFHLKFGVVVTSNVKMDQCCPQLRIFILMFRLYLHTYMGSISTSVPSPSIMSPFILYLPHTLIPLSRVGTYNMFFHHVVIKIRQLFLRPAVCLTSTLLETGVGANDCKFNRDQRLNMPSKARRSSR